MTGRLAVHEPGSALALDDPATEPHLRAWWRLDDDRVLTFHDIRRFGRIHVVDTGDYRNIPTLHALGPEPWDPDFNGKHLAAFVKRSDRHLKTILLAQRAVAGVGNIYADEALWDARINPATRRLSPNEPMSSSSRSGRHSNPDLRMAARPFGTMSTPTARRAAIGTNSPATDEEANRACAVAKSSVPGSSTLARPPGARPAKLGNRGQPVRDRGRSGRVTRADLRAPGRAVARRVRARQAHRPQQRSRHRRRAGPP